MTNDIAVQDDGPISAAEREAHLQALILYYSGAIRGKGDAFTAVEGTSIGTFYNRRKEYPELIEAIEQEARLKAMSERDEEEMSFEGELIAKSRELQEAAADALQQAIPVLAGLARGEPLAVSYTDDEGKEKERKLIVHPKDVIAAAKTLQDIASQGARTETRRIVNVLPEPIKDKPPALPEPEEEKEEPIQFPRLPPGTDFSQVTARQPDGTTYVASVQRAQTIDAEDIEVESDDEE